MKDYKRALCELIKNINKDSSLERLYKLALFLYLERGELNSSPFFINFFIYNLFLFILLL